MIKGYTDIKQSQILAEILPTESADMSYSIIHNIGQEPYHCNVPTFTYVANGDIPCWSLAALLNLLPSEFIYSEIIYEIRIRKYALTKNVDLYQIAYGSIKFDVDGQHSFKDMVNTGEKENLVDVCYEMIVELKERNLI